MIKSKVLDHYQSFGIWEVERYPAYWTQEMVEKAAKDSKWSDLGTDIALVTIGQFRCLLCPLIH